MIRFLNRLSQIRRRYSQRPFWFRTEFQKGHCFCYCVFRKLSYVNQPEFLWRSSHRNSGFFYFQKGRLPFGVLFQPFFCFGRTAFFVFLEHYSVPQKGHWRKWRLKLKNPNNGSSKLKRTRPEYRSHTGPPAQTEKPICTEFPLCEGCPFPGHGFLCQGVDGECMRTRLMKLSEKEDTK